MKLPGSFLSDRHFKVLPKTETPTAGDSRVFPVFYLQNLSINHVPRKPDVSRGFFAIEIFIWATYYKEGYVFKKPQRNLTPAVVM
jgi:hypothetical protein